MLLFSSLTQMELKTFDQIHLLHSHCTFLITGKILIIYTAIDHFEKKFIKNFKTNSMFRLVDMPIFVELKLNFY